MPHATAFLGSFTVNRMGYGAMQLAGPQAFGPPKDRDTAIAVLREAVASGVNHIDTSDYYGPFIVNELIREALHPYPDDLVLVTKVGALRGDDGSWQKADSKKQLTKAIHDNLRRLDREVIDVVNLRAMFSPLGPAEGSLDEQMGVMAELQRQGLIRHIGLSNVTPKQVAGEEPGAGEGARGWRHARHQRHQHRHRTGEVRRRDLHQDAALEGALVRDSDLAVREIAQAAVHELGGPARGPEGEVVGVHGKRGQSAGGRVERDAGAGDAESDDDHVDVVGEARDSVADEARGAHGASTREISRRASS